MPTIDIERVGSIGLIKDEKPYLIDPMAWTEALNVRYVDNEVESVGGRVQVFGSLPDAPVFLLPVSTGSQTIWVWASLTKVYGWDGVSHTEITHVSGPYVTNFPREWNGVLFSGIGILNNGLEAPQAWLNSDVGVPLVDLPNWPSGTKAKVIRALGPYLVGINIVKSATEYPHRVKWSHAADPGSVPSSWDETNPFVDAGESELPDVASGGLVDALNLQGQLILYKENATWRMRYIGGQFIFSFDSFLETSGILAARCAGITGEGQRHFVVTQDDVIIHDGNTQQSILTKKARKYLFSRIDPNTYLNSFVFTNFQYKEMWFCYPTAGSTNPNMALVWNYENGAVSEVEVDFVAAATGPIETTDTLTWATDPGNWNTDDDSWSNVDRRKVLGAKPSTSKIIQLDTGDTFDGVVARSTLLSRTDLALIGKARDGTPRVDFNQRKMITRLWPRMIGGPVQIRAGAQDGPGGPIRWGAFGSFDPTTQKWVDLVSEGAAMCIEVATSNNEYWRLEGYKVDLSLSGKF